MLASQVTQPRMLEDLQNFTVTMDNQLCKLETSKRKLSTPAGKKGETQGEGRRTRSGGAPKEGNENWVSPEEIQ